MKHWQFIFLILCSSHVQLWSQSPPVELIGIEQGLSQGFVTCMLQDQEGFIWAGTMNGLNRYDGQRMKVFVSDPHDSLSLSSSAIGAIHDFGDCMLVGTYGTGLNIFCKKSQRFFRLPYHLPGLPHLPIDKTYTGNSLPAENVNNEVVVDADGHIWLLSYNGIFTHKAWVVRMEVPKGFWEELPSNPSLVAKLKFQAWHMEGLESKWHRYLIGGERQIICLKRDQAVVFDHQQQNWVPLRWSGNLMPVLANVVFAEDKQSSLMQDADMSTWHCIGNESNPLGKLPGLVFFINDKKLWLRENGWLRAYEIGQSLATVDWAAPLSSIPIKDARTVTMFDRSGNLWFADDISGLAKYSTINGRFRHFFRGQSLMTRPHSLNTSGFGFLKNSGMQFAGKPDPGLRELQRILEQERLYAFMLNTDANGNYWLAGYNPILGRSYVLKFDAKTGQPKWWTAPKPEAPPYFSMFDEAGMFWFTAGGMLARFDPGLPETASDGQRWAFFDFSALGTAGDMVVGMAKTADGSWWMATMKGLVQAKPKGGQFDFQLHRAIANDRNSLPSNNVACVVADPRDANLLWIGTKGGGLSRLDTRTGSFQHLTTKDGLPNDVIYGILPDDEGRFWLSSNRGLIRYNPATGEIKSLRQADGLQSDEFNSHAYAKAPNGDLMFGGVNGLNVFDPKDLVDNPMKPRVLLTGLKINNQPVSVRDEGSILDESIEFCKAIVLPFSKNNITFEFAALEFTAPIKNRFRYYLKGAEAKWAHEGYEPQATYLNLPPGNYTFIVNGTNNDGVWSDVPAELLITILAPWYRTWLAYLIYLSVLMGLAYWLVRDWMKKQELRQALELKEKEGQHLKEMNQLKLDEFTHRILEKSQLIVELEGRLASGEEAASDPGEDDSGETAEYPDKAAQATKPEDLHRLYRSQILTAGDWENFKTLFDRVHPGYMPQVMYRYPQLTPAESRLVMLTKMGLSTAEIAAMVGVSTETVKKTRQRLRKKLEANNVDLDDLVALL
jgi:ligand-binding sensor domain-containing protein/DNA-binding CsgD family transcriptional regulator